MAVATPLRVMRGDSGESLDVRDSAGETAATTEEEDLSSLSETVTTFISSSLCKGGGKRDDGTGIAWIGETIRADNAANV